MFYNADSGLYSTQYRAYDPITGRWLSRDPFGEMSDPVGNLYRYVNNNPITNYDPDGRFGWRGAVAGAATNAGLQFVENLFHNGGDWQQAAACINFTNVGVAAVAGAVAPTFGGDLLKTGFQWAFRGGPITPFAANVILYGGYTLSIKTALDSWIPPLRLGSGCPCENGSHAY
jgi:RHS repeat-associated protein